MDGFARRLADAGKIFTLQNTVEHRGFSDVRLARKGDLRQAVRRKHIRLGSGLDKFDFL